MEISGNLSESNGNQWISNGNQWEFNGNQCEFKEDQWEINGKSTGAPPGRPALGCRQGLQNKAFEYADPALQKKLPNFSETPRAPLGPFARPGGTIEHPPHRRGATGRPPGPSGGQAGTSGGSDHVLICKIVLPRAKSPFGMRES